MNRPRLVQCFNPHLNSLALLQPAYDKSTRNPLCGFSSRAVRCGMGAWPEIQHSVTDHPPCANNASVVLVFFHLPRTRTQFCSSCSEVVGKSYKAPLAPFRNRWVPPLQMVWHGWWWPTTDVSPAVKGCACDQPPFSSGLSQPSAWGLKTRRLLVFHDDAGNMQPLMEFCNCYCKYLRNRGFADGGGAVRAYTNRLPGSLEQVSRKPDTLVEWPSVDNKMDV